MAEKSYLTREQTILLDEIRRFVQACSPRIVELTSKQHKMLLAIKQKTEKHGDHDYAREINGWHYMGFSFTSRKERKRHRKNDNQCLNFND